MHSGTQKCVYYLHIHFCLTFFISVPSSCSRPFYSNGKTWRTEDKQSCGERGTTVCFKERRQTSTVQFSAAVHPSSFLTITGFCVPEQPLFLLSGAISSSGVDHVQHKAQSDIGEFTEGQFSNPDFPYSTVLSAIS